MEFCEYKLTRPLIKYCINVHQAFDHACLTGELNLAQELHENYVINIDLKEKNNLFCTVCRTEYLAVAQWLKLTYPDIDHMKRYTALQFAIMNERTNIVEWLISIWCGSNLEIVFHLCYYYNMHAMIGYIFQYHDVEYMQFTEHRFIDQKKFDRDYERYRVCVKSARKTLN